MIRKLILLMCLAATGCAGAPARQMTPAEAVVLLPPLKVVLLPPLKNALDSPPAAAPKATPKKLKLRKIKDEFRPKKIKIGVQ